MKFSGKICVPVREETMKKCLEAVKKIEKEADVLEIWLDCIRDLDLYRLMKFQRKPFLIVNRGKKEMGGWGGGESERVGLLKEACRLGAKYIDIGIHTPQKLIQDLVKCKYRAKLIISFHDFKKTPPDKKIQEVIKKARALGADIVKIATFARDFSDTLRLMTLLEREIQKKRNTIAIPMGEKGSLGRLLGAHIGNYLTFVPFDSKSRTAPGQIVLEDWKKLIIF